MKLARILINNLENQGPAGLLNLPGLSDILDRPIRVWLSTGRLHSVINAEKDGRPIDVEYHRCGATDTGHWTLPGGIDALNSNAGPNDCLFSVISYQTGLEPGALRRMTIESFKRKINRLERQMPEVARIEKRDKSSLMIGGAKYAGTSPRDAARILDNSQNVYCEGCRETGHPRGHASHPEATGDADSVERYSVSGMKSGFLSRSDQNNVAHVALRHQRAREAMRLLNDGTLSLAVQIPIREINGRNFTPPKMREYYQGQAITGDIDINSLTLVLRHHRFESNNPDADVFVHTFYPRSR